LPPHKNLKHIVAQSNTNRKPRRKFSQAVESDQASIKTNANASPTKSIWGFAFVRNGGEQGIRTLGTF